MPWKWISSSLESVFFLLLREELRSARARLGGLGEVAWLLWGWTVVASGIVLPAWVAGAILGDLLGPTATVFLFSCCFHALEGTYNLPRRQAANGVPIPFGLRTMESWVPLPIPARRIFAASALVDHLSNILFRVIQVTMIAGLGLLVGAPHFMIVLVLLHAILTGWATNCLLGAVSLYLRSRWLRWLELIGWLKLGLLAAAVPVVLFWTGLDGTGVLDLLAWVETLSPGLILHPLGWPYFALCLAPASPGYACLVMMITSLVAGLLVRGSTRWAE